jgi:hypothetical protein
MSLIFENSIRFNTEGSPIAGIAQYFKAKLEKYVERINVQQLSEKEFTAKLSEITARYLDILAHPPEVFDPGPYEVKFEKMTGGLKVAALDALAEQLNKLVDAGDVGEITEVLGEGNLGEGGDTLVEIDVGDLAEQDLEKLWALVREKNISTW